MKTTITKSSALALVLLLAAAGWFTYQIIKPGDEQMATTGPTSPSSEFLNAESAAAFYETQLRSEPGNANNQIKLAQVYLQLAHDKGDEPVFIPKAEALLNDILEQEPNNYYARVLYGQLLNVLHRFEDARDVALGIIADHPREAFSYGLLVDALVELGEYEAAVEACDKMLALRPSLPAYARAAYIRELYGDTDGAIEAMTLAAEAGVAGQANRAWALYNLGTLYLGMNQPETAAAIFTGILEEKPDFARAVGGLGQVAQIDGRLEEAVQHFENAFALEPRDEFLEHLADIHDELGNEQLAGHYAEQVIAGLEAARAMGERVDMEYADLLADREERLSEALEWAESEYQRRPGHLHALETYAWALHKAGRDIEAVPFIEEAMRLGTGDAMVYFRAAHIYRGAGLEQASQDYFQRALDANLHVESRLAANEARAMILL